MIESIVTVALVANVLPILPVVLQFTEGLSARERRALLLRAVLAGNLVAAGAALGGGWLIHTTRVTVDDLRVSGGIILWSSPPSTCCSAVSSASCRSAR
ncbi:MAG: MarC family protein [Kofleriaceae bacterium]